MLDLCFLVIVVYCLLALIALWTIVRGGCCLIVCFYLVGLVWVVLLFIACCLFVLGGCGLVCAVNLFVGYSLFVCLVWCVGCRCLLCRWLFSWCLGLSVSSYVAWGSC